MSEECVSCRQFGQIGVHSPTEHLANENLLRTLLAAKDAEIARLEEKLRRITEFAPGIVHRALKEAAK